MKRRGFLKLAIPVSLAPMAIPMVAKMLKEVPEEDHFSEEAIMVRYPGRSEWDALRAEKLEQYKLELEGIIIKGIH